MVRAPSQPDDPCNAEACRLNLLLSAAPWQQPAWTEQLPALLAPLGVRAIRAASGRQATQVIATQPIHIALVDLSLPLHDCAKPADSEEGGERILQLLGRLDCPPPTVVLRRRRAARESDRVLTSALNAGAFAVLDMPVSLELALETMRRVLRRHYADRWPAA